MCSLPDRCNLALMLIQDVVVDGLESPSLVWPLHVPFMLHIIFLGLDNARPLVHENCESVTVCALSDCPALGEIIKLSLKYVTSKIIS